MKKCRRCPNPATLHITEIHDGNAVAVHLCEECAQEYLDNDAHDPATEAALEIAAKFEALDSSSETHQDLACPSCGITFAEFREHGRLGCPHCYEEFREELAPLLENVHETVIHEGKRPSRSPTQSEDQNRLIRLRGQLKEAIEKEDYEKAAHLRDEISAIETEASLSGDDT